MYVSRSNEGLINGAFKWPNEKAEEKIDENSKEYLAWLNPPPTSREIKLTGFEFESVMISATGRDANGLLQVARAYDKGLLQPTMFYFENGNTLIITNDNFPELEAVWSQFRVSFYKPE